VYERRPVPATCVYDQDGHLASRSVAGGTVSYLYFADGALAKRTNADASWTAYIGGMYEKNSDGSVVKYYSALGKTIAIRQVPSGGGAGTLLYPLTDHLGSTVGLLGTSGNLVPNSKTAYWPYGAVRSGGPITQTDKLYTGQQIEPGDSALGLYNYKARFYSTVLGRFVSADSSTKDGPNRYAYVRDNPARYNDPSGKKTAQEKDAEDDAANLRRLAAWGLDTPEKVRLALLAADGYNAKWAGAGLIFAGALSNGQPIRLHSRETILEDNQSGYDFWSTKSTDEIIASLKPGNAEGYPPLTLNENGVVMDGNTRLQVLVDRGYNLTELPVEPLIHTRVTFEEPAEPVDPNPGDFEGAPLSELPGVTEGDASDTEDCTVDPASCDY
jgi:RHS repeat-associated protein